MSKTIIEFHELINDIKTLNEIRANLLEDVAELKDICKTNDAIKYVIESITERVRLIDNLIDSVQIRLDNKKLELNKLKIFEYSDFICLINHLEYDTYTIVFKIELDDVLKIEGQNILSLPFNYQSKKQFETILKNSTLLSHLLSDAKIMRLLNTYIVN